MVLAARAAPAFAGQELLFEKGIYGPNEVIRVEIGNGDATFACGPDGFPDSPLFTLTDFYVVPTGTIEAGNLLFGDPVTVRYSSSAGFYGVAFGFTRRYTGLGTSVGIGNGTYDVVFDECEDGVFDLPNDFIVRRAFRVDVPLLLPSVAPSMARFKAEARREVRYWADARVPSRDLLHLTRAVQFYRKFKKLGEGLKANVIAEKTLLTEPWMLLPPVA